MTYWDKKTINKIRRGYFSAVYFNKTKHILSQEVNLNLVTMQLFQKKDKSVFCGVDEAVELLKKGTGYFKRNRWVSKWSDLKVRSLPEGSQIKSGESVMHIIGPYTYFAHLESLYLGILARRTLVASNTRGVVKATNKKPVMFFADRFDHFLNQEGDGYAAKVGGATAVCTLAQAVRVELPAIGTIPHALIAVNKGDLEITLKQFVKHFKKVRAIALVDFNNDCVADSLKAARVLGRKLWGVRLDTAQNMIDKSLVSNKVKNKLNYGVNPKLVKLVRKTLNKEGFEFVKIVVSGGFDEKKVTWFEKEKTPVDVYGVGSSLVHGNNDFTADIVKVGGKNVSKSGRSYRGNKKFKCFS